MILDSLEHAPRYYGLGERIACALRFLQNPEVVKLEPPGFGSENSLRLEVQGEKIFALVQRYQTRSVKEAFWEAHRKYIDIQYMVDGEERMGSAALNSMHMASSYDDEKDYLKLTECDDSGNFVRVRAGMFAIFMPHDAHMPGLMVNGVVRPIKKIVMKVLAQV